jgi:hypothetical protein
LVSLYEIIFFDLFAMKISFIHNNKGLISCRKNRII